MIRTYSCMFVAVDMATNLASYVLPSSLLLVLWSVCNLHRGCFLYAYEKRIIRAYSRMFVAVDIASNPPSHVVPFSLLLML